MEIAGPSKPKSLDLFLVSVLIFGAVLSRCIYIVRPFDSDSAMFIYMGKLISEGGRFGHEIVDNKFPTVGLLMSAPWRLLGSNWPLWVMLGAVLSGLACWRLVRAAGRAFGSRAAIPALLAGIVLLNFSFTVWGGFQLETLHIFFASLAAAAGLDALRSDDPRDSFLLGLSAAMGAYAKPTALAVVVAFAIVMIVQLRRRPARLVLHGGMTLIGVLIPAATFLVYLIFSNSLRDMPALFQQISLYAKNSAWGGEDLKKLITLVILAGFPFFIIGAVFRRRRIDHTDGSQLAVWFVALWLGLELLGVILQRRMYAYHFMPITAPLVLLFAAMPRRVDIRTIACALIPMSLFSLIGAANVLRYGYEPHRTLLASEYLQQHAIAGERVWADDVPRLILETELRTGSRHPITFLFANDDDAALRFGNAILEDLQSQKPRYIVLPTELAKYILHQQRNIRELEDFERRRENYGVAWGWIESFVKQHYTPAARAGRDTVWVLRDPPAADVASGREMQ